MSCNAMQRNAMQCNVMQCMYVRMHGWMDVWMDGWMYVWMYVCMHACMHVCMYVLHHIATHGNLDFKVEDAACGPGSSCDRTMLLDNYDRRFPREPGLAGLRLRDLRDQASLADLGRPGRPGRHFSCTFSDALKRHPTYKLFWSEPEIVKVDSRDHS